MKEIELEKSKIAELFKGTDFGGPEKTDVGRRGLMVECVLKRAAAYHDGKTITTICTEAGLLTENGKPLKAGLRWAFLQLYASGPPTILERLRPVKKERKKACRSS